MLPPPLAKVSVAAIASLLLATAGQGKDVIFDSEAARMLQVPSTGEPGHSAPPPKSIAIPKDGVRASSPSSLAKPTVTLPREEQPHFGPRSGGRRYDPRMIEAARIARARAEAQKTWYCWRYVKNALLAAGVVDSRPASAYAKEAGKELCEKYGFVRLPVRDPMRAPVGAVVVYGGADAGHVEIRTENGFVSDFVSRTPYPRPLVGVFVKPT